MKAVVLMSSYNGENYIREQIDSVLAQKGDFSLDIIVRDDGSKDGTLDILREYEKAGKLRWYNGENLGPEKSFIDLVKHSGDYDYYSFCDQDDYWLPEKISLAIENLGESKSPALYFSNAMLVDSELNSLGRNVYKTSPRLDFKTLCCAGGILGCTTVFNNALADFIKSKPIPEKMVMHDFYVDELCLAVGGSIVYDSTPTMKYRQHSNNVVGVSSGIMGKIKNRFGSVTKAPKVSISEQAESLLKNHRDDIADDKVLWLERIADYRKEFFSRLKLCFSTKTKYINRNMGLKLRLSILLGNR